MSPYIGCSSSPSCSNSSSKSYRQGLRGSASFLQHLFLFLSQQRGCLLVLLCLSLLSIFANEAVAQTVSVPATQTVAEPAAHTRVSMTFTGPGGSGDYATPSIVSGGTASGRQNNGTISCAVGDDFVVDRSDSGVTITAGQSTHTHDTFTVCADTVDEPDETFTIGWGASLGNPFDSNASHCTSASYCTTTFTITDDDPTEVSLARVGSGAVTEGQKIEFTVTLGRALVAGETIDVPLSIGGTNVTTGDWSLALKPGATNTGVARRIGSVVRFSGAGAQTATLELTATNDNTADHNETFNIALGMNTDFDDGSLGTNVGGGADPHNSNNAFSVTVNEPPPSVSLHPEDVRAGENGNPAGMRLRLRRALQSGETLTVNFSVDFNLRNVQGFQAGTSVTHTSGNPTTGTVTITGPNAPKDVDIYLYPAGNTVNRWASGVEVAEFKLTSVSGVAGAEVSGMGKAKIFVNDSGVSRTTYMSAWSREVEEGGELIVMLHGKAGKKRNSGPRPYDWYNVTVGVQNITTSFADLGEGYRGRDAFGGYLRREGDTDYYNVGVLGMGRSAELVIPIQSDGTNEGDERFRVFIAETPGNQGRASYMGVRGTYNSLYAAPGIDFTIKGQSGGQRSPSQQPEPPPVPTQAVSNIQVTALDADSAEVTWDAVEHATSYELEWEGVSIAGINADITGTTSTIDHHAPEPMTLTITVIPQYIDENGDTQQLNDLSGTAVFDVGGNGLQSSDVQDSIQSQDGTQAQDDNNQQQEEDCDLDEVQSDVENYVLETYNGDAHVARWQRVLNAFAGNDGGMSGVEARFMATLFSANRWEPAAKAIECLEEARGKDNTYAELIAKMYEWRYDTRYVSYKSHTNRWDRALLAFGESVSDSSLEPMTAADAQVFADRGWSRWVEVAKALWKIE